MEQQGIGMSRRKAGRRDSHPLHVWFVAETVALALLQLVHCEVYGE